MPRIRGSTPPAFIANQERTSLFTKFQLWWALLCSWNSAALDAFSTLSGVVFTYLHNSISAYASAYVHIRKGQLIRPPFSNQIPYPFLSLSLPFCNLKCTCCPPGPPGPLLQTCSLGSQSPAHTDVWGSIQSFVLQFTLFRISYQLRNIYWNIKWKK